MIQCIIPCVLYSVGRDQAKEIPRLSALSSRLVLRLIVNPQWANSAIMHLEHTQPSPPTLHEAGMASGITVPTLGCGDGNLRDFIQQQWELTGQLVEKTRQLKQSGHIHGTQRVERKLRAERAFLESVRTASFLL